MQMAGIELISVNPAIRVRSDDIVYKKYGMSSHESAALVIGRKCLSFKRG